MTFSDEIDMSAVEQLLDKLRTMITEGIEHGYFDISVSCRVVNEKKREILLKSGKSFVFIIGSSKKNV